MPAEREFYEFGPFRLDASRRVLLRDGEPMAGLTPKVVETLAALVRRGGDIVAKDELMEAVWPDAHVEESNLTSNISLLRKALGAAADGRPYIETFPKRGYRFNLAPPRAPETPPAAEVEADLLIRRTTRRVLRHEELTEETDAPAGESRAAPAVAPRPEPLPAARPRRSLQRRVILPVALAAGLALALFVAWGALRGRGARQVKISRLTANGIASHAAVSPDGKYVVHVAGEEGRHSLQLKHVATGSDTEIVPPGPGLFNSLTFSPEGDYVYFVKYENSGRVYRVPILGGLPHRLAVDDVDSSVSFSPDGRWVVYVSESEGKRTLWKVPVEGGEAVRLTEYAAGRPAVSPDGRFVVFSYPDKPANRWRVGLIHSEGGEMVRRFEAPLAHAQVFRWLAGGSAFTYLEARGGVSNVWRQPLDGGQAAPLTSFTEQTIFNYALAPGGEALALARGSLTTDVVLVRGFR